jgi:phosphoribosylamine---glycine ligase
VLGVTALGSDLGGAREHAYTTVDLIAWPEGFCRRDIAAPR